MGDMMRAVVRHRYGSPDVLEIQEVGKPIAADDEVLVRVHAVSVNPSDRYMMLGLPLRRRRWEGLWRPNEMRLGTDFAGTVEAVGPGVTSVRPGDEVFGGKRGAFADYVYYPESAGVQQIVRKPAGLTFEQAAAVPVAALTALQGLRDHGRLQPGQKVLINGASGGVGTFAVQIAKALGAEVTAVCSTRNVELVRSLGANHVIDYTREDFTRRGQRYDLLLSNAGSRSWREYQRVLHPDASYVHIGGPMNRLLGRSIRQQRALRAARRRGRTFHQLMAAFTKADLELLSELLETGQVTPVIDRHYKLSEIADALRYLGRGHAQGKIVITV
jgi:NADPH:quinone reductase-like Zn-dependent oxidoreductase